MRPQLGQTLRRYLIAVAVAIAGLCAFSASASAVVSNAPDITATPSNPNTTHAVSSFTYNVSNDETSTATQLRYYCRIYDADAAPPAAGTGWAACGTTLSASPGPATRTYAQANGNWTFEVAIRETTNISTQGPISTYSWTQNIPAPAKAPAVTSSPDDPKANSTTSAFTYIPGDGETNLIDRFECRLDSTEESGWASCPASGKSYLPGNGDHTFEVRAGNILGWSPPSDTVTWTVDIPNGDPSVDVGDIGSTTWLGAVANNRVGDKNPANRRIGSLVQNVGDINDDGIDDWAVGQRVGLTGLVDVIYGSPDGSGTHVLGTQNPSQGFRIPWTGSALVGLNIGPAGDQNGDGIDDFVVSAASSDQFRYYVVYGGSLDEELAPCSGNPSVRCLDVKNMSPDRGYVIQPTTGQLGASTMPDAGDFDGDGTDDLMFVATSGPTGGVVIKGKARTGTVMTGDLPNDEILMIPVSLNRDLERLINLGDLDGDGKTDIMVMSDFGSENTVLYGRSINGEIDLSAVTPDEGFKIYKAPVELLTVAPVGDMNDDGRGDLAIRSEAVFVGGFAPTKVEVHYTPERGSDGVIAVGDVELAGGYLINPGIDDLTGFGWTPASSLGDMNNDGAPDFLSSAPAGDSFNGLPGFGTAYLLFGQNPVPSDPLAVGPGLTPELGVGIRGPQGEGFGTSFDSMGDLDGDGLVDFAVGAPTATANGLTNAGAIHIIYGKSLIANPRTGSAVGVTNDSAVLNAPVATNNRDSEVWFEYGASADYGQTTDPEEFDGSSAGDAAAAAIDGLEKGTEYHYRVAARNELGLVRYGDDRTFTTTNDPDPLPVSNCETDDTLPGCAKYDPCAADDTKPGCPKYDHCAVKPADCAGGGSNAKLAIVSVTKKIQVKRGKRGVHQVAVINTGGKAANGVKVCVKAPRKLVKVKRCFKVGSLGSGASRTVKVKVQAKKKRGKAVLSLTASGNGLSAKKTKATVVIR